MFNLTVPDTVWRLNIDVPEEARDVSLDNTEDRWWDQTELTKLILASNLLTELSEDIVNFTALTVLDVGGACITKDAVQSLIVDIYISS
jgi:hypothetical protein